MMNPPPATAAPTASKSRPTPAADKAPWRPQPWWLVFVVLMIINYSVAQVFFPAPPSITVPYTFFKTEVEAGNVADVTSVGDSIHGTFKTPVPYPRTPGPTGTARAATAGDEPDARTLTEFTTRRPTFADQDLERRLEAQGVVIQAVEENPSSWSTLLVGFGPTLLLIGAFVLLSRRAAASAGGGLFGLGRSRAKQYSEASPTVTFDDVAGIDEAEAELVEIVDFLKNPDKYQRLGGTVPKGVLLIGAPGTGKTLLARAVAGQAGVPFFSLSASEFIEMIVGVGASRVRDLFKEARAAAPAIIFIDELDAIGRTRGTGAQLGGHEEREQTLNQILTEMDGFDSREGVIVLAATNRADVLDQALLRPGRFDRRVVVQRPDRAGRAAILKVHTRAVPLAPDVSLERLAAETPGLVGAELRNLVNEAALLAARQGASAVGAEAFAEALQKITLGPARNILLNPADRERTAYHEAGHALLALVVPASDPVHRVSIVPRGMALGATYQLPVDDRTSYAEDYLRARITCALGGRAAEKLVYGVVTTGAENDLQQVTEVARHMVLRWGMSEKLGPISFVAPQDEGLPPAFQQRPYSEATSELIDAEVRRIVEESHADADRRLVEHRDKLDALAHALLKAESLNEREIRDVTGLTEPSRLENAEETMTTTRTDADVESWENEGGYARRVAVLIVAAMCSVAGSGVAAAAPVEPEAHTLLDVPDMPQTPELCGGAAVAMVLRYWGVRDVFPQDFASLVSRGDGGILTATLTAAVRDRRWLALVVPAARDTARARIQSEIDRGRPLIALIEVAPRTYHYVVIVGLTDGDVVLHDPARAPFRVLRWAEFERAWEATDRWMMLALPPVGFRPDDDDEVPQTTPASSGVEVRDAGTPCGALVGRGVQLALTGERAEAEQVLGAATRICPNEAAAWRELAGLRFSESRWSEARDLALSTVRLAPDDTYAWQVVAASRYLMGDTMGALDAWNHAGEPSIDTIAIHGADRTRQPVVARAAGWQPRQVLTSGAFGRAQRRLRELPVASNARMQYEPTAGGLARVEIVLDERQALPGGRWDVVAHGARALLLDQLQLDVAGLLGAGETATVAWRWAAGRPSLAVDLALPSPHGLPGVVSLSGLWERQTYAAVRGARRRVGLHLADWSASWLRWQTGAALDRLSVDDDRDEGPVDTRDHLAVDGSSMRASACARGAPVPVARCGSTSRTACRRRNRDLGRLAPDVALVSTPRTCCLEHLHRRRPCDRD